MTKTITDSSLVPHVNSLHVARTQDSGALAIVRRVLKDLDIKHEAAASAAGVKPSQFSAALSGQGNFGLTWLWKQGDDVLLLWIEQALEARGLKADPRRAMRLARMLELLQLIAQEVRGE